MPSILAVRISAVASTDIAFAGCSAGAGAAGLLQALPEDEPRRSYDREVRSPGFLVCKKRCANLKYFAGG